MKRSLIVYAENYAYLRKEITKIAHRMPLNFEVVYFPEISPDFFVARLLATALWNRWSTIQKTFEPAIV